MSIDVLIKFLLIYFSIISCQSGRFLKSKEKVNKVSPGIASLDSRQSEEQIKVFLNIQKIYKKYTNLEPNFQDTVHYANRYYSGFEPAKDIVFDTYFTKQGIFANFGFFISEEDINEFRGEFDTHKYKSYQDLNRYMNHNYAGKIELSVAKIQKVLKAINHDIKFIVPSDTDNLKTAFLQLALSESNLEALVKTIWRDFAGRKIWTNESIQHFKKIVQQQGYFGTISFILNDWGEDILARLYHLIFLEGSDEVDKLQYQKEIAEFRAFGHKYLIQNESNQYNDFFRDLLNNRTPFFVDIDKLLQKQLLNKFDSYVGDSAIQTYLQANIEVLKQQLLTGEKTLYDVYTDVVALYHLQEKSDLLLDRLFRQRLRRGIYPEEFAHYKKRLSTGSFWDIEFDIFMDRPQYRFVDWRKIPIWSNLKTIADIVETSLEQVAIPHVNFPYNASLVNYPQENGNYLMAYREDFNFGTSDQTSRFGFIKFHPTANWKQVAIDGSFGARFGNDKKISKTMEDPRLVYLGNDLYVFYNDHGDNEKTRKMFFSKINFNDRNEIIFEQPMKLIEPQYFPYGIEKNWIPFSHEGQIYLIYAFDVQVFKLQKQNYFILSLDLQTGQTELAYSHVVDYSVYKTLFGAPRGGSPLVHTEDGFVSIFHSSKLLRMNEDKDANIFYMMGGMLIDDKPPFKIKAMTRYPIVSNLMYDLTNQSKPIVFPAGLVREGERLIVSAGWQDQFSSLYVLNYQKFIEKLKDDHYSFAPNVER